MIAALRLKPRLLACGWMAVLASRMLGAASDGRPEIYVWQRQWTPAVNASLEAVAGEVGAVQVLAAEVGWRNGRLEVFRAQPDYATLKKLGASVGVVVRIGPFGGPFSRDDAVAAQLVAVVVERLQAARAAGVEPVEVQIDFDCAETKLAGYRAWLIELREAAGSVPLVFTALPAWLNDERDFRALTEAADGFVLQVHSLEKPREVNASVVLCDPARARAWAEQASRLGAPFRVALPTYGYELGFSAEGKFIGLGAEGPRRPWPEGTQIREVRADVDAMRDLARELSKNPLANFAGVIWFRLPVDGDRLNWDVRTLVTVMRGEEPKTCLHAGIAWSEDDAALAEVYLENAGDVNVTLPQRVIASWPEEARILALDALAGYALPSSTVAADRAMFVRDTSRRAAVLSPGRRLRVGWIRFSHEISLHLEIGAEPSAGWNL